MADASEVAELWQECGKSGELPPENNYTIVQQKTVPYQELLTGSDAFKPFQRAFRPHLLGIERWLLRSITVGTLSSYLHELNPLPVKLDRNAGYQAVCDINTCLWDLEWQPGYGRFLIDRTTISWMLATQKDFHHKKNRGAGRAAATCTTADAPTGAAEVINLADDPDDKSDDNEGDKNNSTGDESGAISNDDFPKLRRLRMRSKAIPPCRTRSRTVRQAKR